MTPEQEVVKDIEAVIAEQSPALRIQVATVYRAMKSLLDSNPQAGALALAHLGAQMAAGAI